MPFTSIFIACVIGGSLMVATLMIDRAQPPANTGGATPTFTQASGRCAQCHHEEIAVGLWDMQRRCESG